MTLCISIHTLVHVCWLILSIHACVYTGSYSAFKKVYEEPIVQSRQPTATSHERDIGEARADEVEIATVI